MNKIPMRIVSVLMIGQPNERSLLVMKIVAGLIRASSNGFLKFSLTYYFMFAIPYLLFLFGHHFVNGIKKIP